MRFNSLWIIALIMVFALAGCTSGDYSDDEEDPPCTTTIGDGAFEGPYRIAFGFGEGAHAAARLFLQDPGRFNVLAAMNGPVHARLLLAELDRLLSDYDFWPEGAARAERLDFWRDALAAFGNPLYINESSNYFPPGLDQYDFFGYHDRNLPGMYSPANPSGAIKTVTVRDPSGVPVEFLLAHDLNNNGTRDTGEPIINWLHEPFDDADGDFIRDSDEAFSDLGIDGVANTDDYGEGNGVYDENPMVANWLANDPFTLLTDADIDLTPGYRQSMYFDSLTDDRWGFAEAMGYLPAILESRLAEVARGDDFCIGNEVGYYDNFLREEARFTEQIWFPEKYVALQLNETDTDQWDEEENAGLLANRWSHALSLISMRMPNGLYDNVPKESKVVYQIREFYSETFAEYVEFGIGFPAGYFDDESDWKKFPVIYVFHDRDSTIHDWWRLLETQGDLANRELIKQALIVVVDGTRDIDEGRGYGYYVDQMGAEIGGAYGAMVEELIAFVESTYRVQTEEFDRDDDEEE